MTRYDILKLMPNASEAFIRANISPSCSRTDTKLERPSGNEPLDKKEAEGRSSERFLVCVTSVRKRLLDEDNLCEKFHVDLCRYAGCIPSDAPECAKIEVSQRKAKRGEIEHTVIEIYKS